MGVCENPVFEKVTGNNPQATPCSLSISRVLANIDTIN